MAALWEAAAPQLIDLRQLRGELLEPVLREEIESWRRLLDWDFNASADLVRRFVAMHALNGYALIESGRPVGYSYYVCEDRKGLIGDLFLCEDSRTPENESRLIAGVLGNLMSIGYVKRVECQLLLLSAPARILPAPAYLATFPRNFMRIDLAAIQRLAPIPTKRKLLFQNWREARQDEAAQVIAAAYQGHVDSKINDQYRSVNGARHFLLNVVQYPGCGTFFQPASWVAYDSETRQACGVCLSSLVATDVGHITQICVLPECKGEGIGYQLLRLALQSLAKQGCRAATLTVTSSNHKAVQLYESAGFRTLRNFSACVWEGF